MNKRRELQDILESIIGEHNVYFQPPENVKLKYPCIIYSLKRMYSRKADNTKYKNNESYDVMLIDKSPISQYVNPLLKIDYCEMDRAPYVSDNLHHYPFVIHM